MNSFRVCPWLIVGRGGGGGAARRERSEIRLIRLLIRSRYGNYPGPRSERTGSRARHARKEIGREGGRERGLALPG